MNFRLNLTLEYEILFGSEYLINPNNIQAIDISIYSKHILVIDSNLNTAKLSSLINYLQSISQVVIIDFIATEDNKNYDYCTSIMDNLFTHEVDRSALIWAIGGGILGDTVGYIASIYKRGLDYVQIPTTLLSQVDSSIGGKVAINNQYGKNLIGAFYTPRLVIIDQTWLEDLAPIEYNNGIFEIVKIFLTLDYDKYTRLIQAYPDQAQINQYIPEAISLKLDVVTQDFWDKLGLRNILNFGHTFAHSLESVSNYTIKHGYAVGYGIVFESYLSYNLGLLSHSEYVQIKNDMSLLGLDYVIFNQYNIIQLAEAMHNDKKNENDLISFICINSIGKYAISAQKNKHLISPEQLIKLYNNFIESLST